MPGDMFQIDDICIVPNIKEKRKGNRVPIRLEVKEYRQKETTNDGAIESRIIVYRSTVVNAIQKFQMNR